MQKCQCGCDRSWEEYYVLTNGRICCANCWERGMNNAQDKSKKSWESANMINSQVKDLEAEIKIQESTPEYKKWLNYLNSNDDDRPAKPYNYDKVQILRERIREYEKEEGWKRKTAILPNSFKNAKWYTKEEAKSYELFELPRIRAKEEAERKVQEEKARKEREKWERNASEEKKRKEKEEQAKIQREKQEYARIKQLILTMQLNSSQLNSDEKVFEIARKTPDIEVFKALHKLCIRSIHEGWHTQDIIKACLSNKNFDSSKLWLELSKSNKSSGCFIATACYGNYDSPEVLVLRVYRDEQFLTNWLGRLFVKFYYFVSPPLAKQIEKSEKVKSFIQKYFLKPIVDKIKEKKE